MRKSIPMSDGKEHLRVRLRHAGAAEFAERPRHSQGERNLRFLSPLESLFFPGLNPQLWISHESKTLRGDHCYRPPRRLIGMSFRPGIPWQVALQQSLPPLSQPIPFCKNEVVSVERISADGTCLTSLLSQKTPQSTGIFMQTQPKETRRRLLAANKRR